MSDRDIVYDINRLASVIAENTEANKRLAEAVEKLVEKMGEEEVVEIGAMPYAVSLEDLGGRIVKVEEE